MKILKIELKNINSLGGDKEYTVDFTDDKFRDVGLFTITGATGAGKTTVLDAITIAMYHKVARFNKSSLSDVLSHGTGDAFSRVTFESEGEEYEAFWSIRTKSKTGKDINKQEKVYLKNLTKGKIISESKRDLPSKVQKITKLNYNQFLRSILLAQGDFASFLLADDKDKGHLLQQIIGEEIYNKIGYKTSDKRREANIELEKIKNELSKDLLTNEDLEKIKARKKDIEKELTELTQKEKKVEELLELFKKKKEAGLIEQDYNKEVLRLKELKEAKKENLERLRLHEKVLSLYYDDIKDVKRLRKEVEDGRFFIQEKQEEIKQFKEQEKKKKEVLEQAKVQLEEAEGLENKWKPELTKVTQLDATIKSEQTNLNKRVDTKKEVQKEVDKLKKEKKELAENKIKQLETQISQLTRFLNENTQVEQIEKNVTGWTVKLSDWKKEISNEKKLKRELQDAQKNKKLFQKELEQAVLNNKEQQDELNKKVLSAKALEKMLADLNIKSLSDKKETVEKEITAWSNALKLTDTIKKVQHEIKQNQENEKKLIQDVEKAKQNKKELEDKIDKAKTALEDARLLKERASKIIALEDERKKLQEGEPCSLCGSTEHPYVSQYPNIELQEDEKRVKDRQEAVEELNKRLLNLTRGLATKENELETIGKTLKSKEKELPQLMEERKREQPLFNNESEKDIQAKLEELETKKEKLIQQIDVFYQRSGDLKKLTEEIEKLREKQDSFKEQKSRLESKIESETKNIEKTSKELEEKRQVIAELTNVLQQEFTQFNLTIPELEKIDDFLEEIKTKVEEYKNKKEEKKTKENNLEILRNKLEDLNEQLFKKEKDLTDVEREVKEGEDSLTVLQNQRYKILPKGISVEDKTQELNLAVDKAKTEVKNTQKDVEKLTKKINDLGIQIREKEKSIEDKIKTIEEQEKIIQQKLKDDKDFSTEEKIRQALLSKEQERLFKEERDEIKTLTIRLEEKQKQLQELMQQVELSKSKLSGRVEDDVSAERKALKLSTDKLREEKGRLDEKENNHKRLVEKNKAIMLRVNEQEKVVNKWDRLFKILGGEKEGFNKYVQRLTLEILLNRANEHLSKLNNRYSLLMKEIESDKNYLKIALVDHYLADTVRSIETSSGGEKFTISLALALGLSDLAGNNVKIDSLFIDEGFGTLDSETLETVISTLESLQQEGKKIGVISHVEALKERIPTQIQIEKKQGGISTLQIVGL